MTNGMRSASGDWPWVVFLDSGCAGSIVSERFILTAAHCAFQELYAHSEHFGFVTKMINT
jgi:secreted trypsin-like serine protease